MIKYHNSPKGPRICIASVQECEYAQAGMPHFYDIREAEAEYQSSMRAAFGIMPKMTAKESYIRDFNRAAQNVVFGAIRTRDKLVTKKVDLTTRFRDVTQKARSARHEGTRKVREYINERMADVEPEQRMFTFGDTEYVGRHRVLVVTQEQYDEMVRIMNSQQDTVEDDMDDMGFPTVRAEGPAPAPESTPVDNSGTAETTEASTESQSPKGNAGSATDTTNTDSATEEPAPQREPSITERLSETGPIVIPKRIPQTRRSTSGGLPRPARQRPVQRQAHRTRRRAAAFFLKFLIRASRKVNNQANDLLNTRYLTGAKR